MLGECLFQKLLYLKVNSWFNSGNSNLTSRSLLFHYSINTNSNSTSRCLHPDEYGMEYELVNESIIASNDLICRNWRIAFRKWLVDVSHSALSLLIPAIIFGTTAYGMTLWKEKLQLLLAPVSKKSLFS